jgi:molybdopterin-binding protein
MPMEGTRMNISARNLLKGRIKQLTPGAVNTEVTIELPGGAEIVSIITKSSAERLHLSQGQEVYAVIKASDVMVATE